MAIQLGNKVRDVISGFEGTVVAKVEYINGCLQWGLKPKTTDGKMPDTVYIDDGQLEVIDGGISLPTKQTGGENMPVPKGIGLAK